MKVTMGNAGKSALIERLIAYSDIGLLMSGEYNPELALDTLSYITPEMQQSMEKLPAFRAVAETQWTKELAPLKKLAYMDIFVYLVERRSKTVTDRQVANYKSLKGYSYYASGWVENTYIAKVSEEFVFGRGYVYQSYPSPSKRPYSVYVCLTPTGQVLSGECKCVAGLGESCSHIAALLFGIEGAIKLKRKELPDDIACTDRTMAWHQPPRNFADKLTKPLKVSEIVFEQPEYGKESRRSASVSLLDFEPRSLTGRSWER